MYEIDCSVNKLSCVFIEYKRLRKARQEAPGLRKRHPPPSMVMLSLRVQSLAIYGVTMSANSQKETLDRVQKISVLVAFAEARIKVRRKHSDSSV